MLYNTTKTFKKSKVNKGTFKVFAEHEYWLNEWNNVIWSDDEAHFEVLNSTNRVLAPRLKREINESFNFIPRVHGGGVLRG